jgi:hypothetical protein
MITKEERDELRAKSLMKDRICCLYDHCDGGRAVVAELRADISLLLDALDEAERERDMFREANEANTKLADELEDRSARIEAETVERIAEWLERAAVGSGLNAELRRGDWKTSGSPTGSPDCANSTAPGVPGEGAPARDGLYLVHREAAKPEESYLWVNPHNETDHKWYGRSDATPFEQGKAMWWSRQFGCIACTTEPAGPYQSYATIEDVERLSR